MIIYGINPVLEALRAKKVTRVRVSARRGAGQAVEISVEDSGRGIAEGDLERIFEPFFSTKAKGIGMGLSISRGM